MNSSFNPQTYGSPETLQARLAAVRPADVELSLSKSDLDPDDLLNLLSPAAADFLEPMARRAYQITRSRFGRIMKLYAPLYLSNVCSNACVYCGFNAGNRIPRRTLTLEEVRSQAAYLSAQGFQSLLLVSGESPAALPVEVLETCIRELKSSFPEMAIEVYPLGQEDYRRLGDAGLYSLAIYQETYCREVYQAVHPAGRKRDYAWRLATPERAAAAGVRQVSLGVLLGLADFRVDVFYAAMHARFLQKQYWRTLAGMSFPRIRKAEGNFQPPHPVSDRDFVQLVTALRLFLPDSPFSLSTREPAELRNHLLPLGFTQVSAGSSTEPGGYGSRGRAADGPGSQFQVEDTRTPAEMAAVLNARGLEPVWKDWETF